MSRPFVSSGSAREGWPLGRRSGTSAASSPARPTIPAPAPHFWLTMSPTAADPGHLQVLILAPTGRDGIPPAELLRRAALSPRICTDLPELVAGLAAGADAVFVAEEALLNRPIEALTAWVEQQPAWS